MVGIGARIRVSATVYVTGEVARAQRLATRARERILPEDNVTHASFAIEKRAGGHTVPDQFVGDANGTTMAQIARGGQPSNDWYLGFNISRKFFLDAPPGWIVSLR